MKAWAHFIVAIILALVSIFFVWIWFVSGQSCIPSPLGVNGCTFKPSEANISFVSLAVLSGFLMATESIIAIKSTGPSLVVAESERQRKYRIGGVSLMTVGAVVAFAGLYAFNNTGVMCPANGCSASELFAIYAPLFALQCVGMLLVALGDLFILKTRYINSQAGSARVPQIDTKNLKT